MLRNDVTINETSPKLEGEEKKTTRKRKTSFSLLLLHHHMCAIHCR